MSVQDLRAAVQIIRNHPGKGFFAGPRDESLVLAAESALGFRFPSTYREFVTSLGAGNFGSAEIYGVIDRNFTESAVPNGVWLTMDERTRGFPSEFLIVGSTGDGDYYCIDTRTPDGQVVIVEPGDPVQKKETVALDFGEFLLRQVQAIAGGR